jgi:hypothetical protein
MTSKYEKNLYNYFSEIIWVTENPAKLYTRTVYKSGEQVEIKETTEEFNLTEILMDSPSENLLIPECGTGGILNKIKINSEKIELDFFPKNLIQKIFSRRERKLELAITNSFADFQFDFILTSDSISKYLEKFKMVEAFSDIDIYNHNVLEGKIILGKKSKIVINKNTEVDEVCQDLKKIEFWVDWSKYKVIKLL